MIIPVIIPQINQTAADGVVEGGGTLHAVRMILSNEIATDTAPSAARVFKDPPVVNWKDTDKNISRDRNTVRTGYLVLKIGSTRYP